MPRTIASRMLLACALTLGIVLMAVAVGAPLVVRQQETDTLGARLGTDASLVGELARDAMLARDDVPLDELAKQVASDGDLRVTLIGPDGVVLGESHDDRRTMDNHADRAEIAQALAGHEGRAIRHSATVGRDYLYVARPVSEAGRVIGVARVALSLSTLDALATRLSGLIFTVAVLGAIAALIVAVVLGRALTKPLVTLTERAARTSDPAAFVIDGPDEVQRLGEALRRMAASAMGERQAAEMQRDRLATLIGEIGDAILIVDGEDRVRLANPAAERMLAAGPLIGHRLIEVVRDHEVLDVARLARLGTEATDTLERAQPQRYVRVVAKPLDRGELLLALHDLSALRRLETVRRDFVANVSHELRTPLTSLKAMAETLEDGAIDDAAAARDFVSRMHREIDGLSQLVAELLALTRIESGSESLHTAELRPAEILNDAARRMAALAERAGLTLEAAAPGDLPSVQADHEKIGQVLTNLIHNAVKFTPMNGAVRLSAARRGEFVAFSVQDSGSGINPDDLARIFERFYKGDQARAGGGTGLGLAIVKHIVQAHGGEVSVASEGEGRGATFTFTLPLAG